MSKFCRNCGKEINENADVCVNCGVQITDKVNNEKICKFCKSKININAKVCPVCGKTLSMSIAEWVIGIVLGIIIINVIYTLFAR